MRNWLLFVFAFLFACMVSRCGYAAEPDSSFDLSMVPVSQALSLYYKEVSKSPYVLCNEVLADPRMVSIRAGGRVLNGPAIGALLQGYGFEAVDRGGVAFVCKASEVKRAADAFEQVVYRVRYRDAGYLVDLLSQLVVGTFANKRAGLAMGVGGSSVTAVSAGSGGSSPAASPVPGPPTGGVGSVLNAGQGDDYLVFSGLPAEAKKLRSLLDQLDAPVGEVVVKAYMYEVGKSASDASALQLVMGAVGSSLRVSVGGDLASNLVRLRVGSVEAVASALSTDARFKVVSSPYVRVRSGKTARFVSGGTQSVLGALVTTGTGVVQQSYERVDSGTILEVSPVVRGDVVDVDLFQQVSSFTAAAVAGQPPILNKRESRTSLSMADGEVVVLAGLKDGKEDGGAKGLPFLPFSLGKSSSSSSSELVLVLEMKRL
jgi:general secretion pathway protein D